jgi:hypothetical protein
MPEDIGEEQLKAAVMEFLLKKGRWGAHYFPLTKLVNWMGRKVRRNGKRVLRVVKELTNQGYLIIHKKGGTVSLNSRMSREIEGFLQNAKKTLK